MITALAVLATVATAWFALGAYWQRTRTLAQATAAAHHTRAIAEHCGAIPPPAQLHHRPGTAECVLRPDHSGSHATHTGMRWRLIPAHHIHTHINHGLTQLYNACCTEHWITHGTAHDTTCKEAR
ncbi:hypothetical protein [Streptomyces albipurpureus]|uniref:Uncharacterized protein n=1 Tax=Streptomyces albipurpureus TaxID=2897419 RepID=A0ABT0UPK0_9ACTN|nr:hypothetical protein [Streptomyces sp. CWNU-1]MCM2390171.1 hypothetical protein [Streptomyces sp. CWNU-1]